MSDYWKSPPHGPQFEIFEESESYIEENRKSEKQRLRQLKLDERLKKEAQEKLEKEKREAEQLRAKKEFKSKYVKVQDRVNPRYMLPPFNIPLSQCFDKFEKRNKEHNFQEVVELPQNTVESSQATVSSIGNSNIGDAPSSSSGYSADMEQSESELSVLFSALAVEIFATAQ
jgi:hypothetical protein